MIKFPAGGAREAAIRSKNTRCIRRPLVLTHTIERLWSPSTSHDPLRVAANTMGAAPKTLPTKEQVADSFLNYYYRVAAKLPDRLGNFYGGSSELDHGEGFCARGAAIADLGNRLPIAGRCATVRRLSVQATSAGAVVVVVIGSYVKDGEKVVFTQTFVLEKQVDSHDEHFFCRNDIFTPIREDDENVVIAVSDAAKPREESTSAPQAQVPVPQSTPVETVPKVPAPSPVTPPKQTRQVETVLTGVLEPTAEAIEDRNVEETAPIALPDSAVNGSASHDEQSPISEHTASHDVPPMTAELELASETTATRSDEAPLGESSLVNGGEEFDVEVEEPQPAPTPTPPVKKTWASIVSAREEPGDGSVLLAKPAIIDEPVAPKPVKKQVENIAPATENITKISGHGSSNRAAPSSNGHRSAHHLNRGNQRSFGPSAVVQLSTLNPSLLQDARGLANSLRDEFGNYGYKLRNVDVKAPKGIAFVEYETIEGVKAAVAHWANGPKAEGPFAGIALQVSEKRPSPGGRRAGSVRGGRGGPRGGRRPRPASTPLS